MVEAGGHDTAIEGVHLLTQNGCCPKRHELRFRTGCILNNLSISPQSTGGRGWGLMFVACRRMAIATLLSVLQLIMPGCNANANANANPTVAVSQARLERYGYRREWFRPWFVGIFVASINYTNQKCEEFFDKLARPTHVICRQGSGLVHRRSDPSTAAQSGCQLHSLPLGYFGNAKVVSANDQGQGHRQRENGRSPAGRFRTQHGDWTRGGPFTRIGKKARAANG